MYAVIETGGKQYRVEKGSVIRVEKIDTPEGEKVVFDRVLMASNKGRIYAGPEAEKVKVEGTVLKQGKADKIIVFKYKAKKGYRKKQGHRQRFTEIQVDKITGGPRAPRAKKAETEKAEAAEKEKAEVKAEKAKKEAAEKKPEKEKKAAAPKKEEEKKAETKKKSDTKKKEEAKKKSDTAKKSDKVEKEAEES
jgi:large subunit ribosomal protein L21